MIVVLLFNRNKERGEELKVPYHARATSARDGNMPGVTAACLIPDKIFILFNTYRYSISFSFTSIGLFS